MGKFSLAKMKLQPNTRANELNAVITEKGRLRISAKFQKNNHIETQEFFELFFDPENIAYGIKFFQETGAGRYKVVRTRGTAQIDLGANLFLHQLQIDKEKKGTVPLEWSTKEECVFVSLTNVVMKANPRQPNRGQANLLQNRKPDSRSKRAIK